MLRTLLVACLSFLLLGLQHETLVHALQHCGARIGDSRDVAAKPAANGACLTCALTAGGSVGSVAADATNTPAAPVTGVLAHGGFGFSSAPPVYYASRAPPTLLG